MRTLAATFFVVTLGICARTMAQRDFLLESDGWNGLSSLREIAREGAASVLSPERVDLAGVMPQDALLLVHPTSDLPIGDLGAFMRDGGRLAVADDFGSAGALLTSFEIARTEVPPALHARRLRGNRNVLVATARVGHPLNEGVDGLVVNHTRVLDHSTLVPLLALDDGGDSAVVLAGAVGAGRLVVIGDSSALINNMLELSGNAQFARNLIEYIADGRRLWLLTGDTEFSGRYRGAERAPALQSLRDALARLSGLQLPPMALSILAVVIAGALLLAAATTLPRRSAYARSMSPQTPPTVAGLAGRLRYYGDGRHNLLPPLLTYKLELEARLRGALALTTQSSPEAVRAALTLRGVAAELADDAARLLDELESLRLAHERPASPPMVSAARFRAMVARGDRVLNALQPEASAPGAGPSHAPQT